MYVALHIAHVIDNYEHCFYLINSNNNKTCTVPKSSGTELRGTTNKNC